MTAVQAGRWLQFFRRRFAVLPDRAELSTLWQERLPILPALPMSRSFVADSNRPPQKNGPGSTKSTNLSGHARRFRV